MAAEPKPNAATETNVTSVLRNMITSSPDLQSACSLKPSLLKIVHHDTATALRDLEMYKGVERAMRRAIGVKTD
jgi:hypothetical protein